MANGRLYAIVHQLTERARTPLDFFGESTPVRRPLAELFNRRAFGDCYKEVWYNECTPLVFIVPVKDIEAPALMFECNNGIHFAVQLNRGEDYC